jgi:hypothetical protein
MPWSGDHHGVVGRESLSLPHTQVLCPAASSSSHIAVIASAAKRLPDIATGIGPMTTSDFMTSVRRRASAYTLENTLAAFDLALHLGCRQIELDVDLTSDSHIVAISHKKLILLSHMV